MINILRNTREELISVNSSTDGDVSIDTREWLLSRAVHYREMIGESYVITRSLQTKFHILASCRDDVNQFFDSVKNSKNISESTLYQCRLETKYIGIGVGTFTDPNFEMDVMKHQKGLSSVLTENEKISVVCMWNENSATDSSATDDQNPSAVLTKQNNLEKRRKKDDGNDQYRNYDFILGSSAEVERLWSMSKYVLTMHGRSMTSQLAVAFMFLKVNERF